MKTPERALCPKRIISAPAKTRIEPLATSNARYDLGADKTTSP